MPIFRDISVRLDIKKVLQGQGMGGCSRPRPEITALSGELLSNIDKMHLLEPALAYESYSITGAGQDRVNLNGGFILNGSLLPVKFPSARKLVAIVCTIGPKLEEAVSEYFNRGEALRGILLDGIGNVALDSLVREACRRVKKESSSQGYQIGSPVSPGIPGFSISEQRTLFKLAPATHIGVRLTASGVMFPRKSISMVIAIGKDMPEQAEDNICDSCNMVASCKYRSHYHALLSN